MARPHREGGQLAALKTQFVFRSHAIDPDQTLASLLAEYPSALPLLVDLGFTPLASGVTREAVASRTTVRQAAETLPINLEQLLVDLERSGQIGKR